MTPIEEKSYKTSLKLATDIMRDQADILSTISIRAAAIYQETGPLIKTVDESGVTMSKADYQAIADFMNALIKQNYSAIASWLSRNEQNIKIKSEILNLL